MIPTLDFLLPSLHPSTLLDVSFPLTAPGKTGEPVVRQLSIKHGEHEAVGVVKRMLSVGDDQVLLADDAFRLSTLQLKGSTDEGEAGPPEVTKQDTVAHRSGTTWTGLTPVNSGAVSSLSSGLLTYHPHASSSSQSRSLPTPVTCIASSSSSATTFAAAGNGLEVSLWDVERTFASSSSKDDAMNGNAKRRKDLEEGETWRAKNVAPNHLRLPQPVHHLSLAYLPDSEDSLVSGTRLGTVRRYDTRAQRKPVHDWKVAREGGIHCVSPGSEHELFFSDRSGLLASLDLRNGRVAYTLPVSSTPQYLLPIRPEGRDSTVGLASIASDATFRLHATSGVERQGSRGDKEKWTRGIVGVQGGVGGQGVWRGWGEIKQDELVVDGEGAKAKKRGGEEDDDKEDDEDDEEGDEEEVWEGMSEVEDLGEEESGDEQEDDSEEEAEAKNSKKRRNA